MTYVAINNSNSPNWGFYSPIEWLTRLCIFKHAVASPKSPWYVRFFFERMQNQLANFGFFGCAGNFDLERAQKTLNTFIELGGEESFVEPSDKEAKIHTIKITVDSLKNKIESLGGRWVMEGDQRVIYPPADPSYKWQIFYSQHLKKLFLKEEQRGNTSVLITSTDVDQSFIPSEHKATTKCVLLSRLGKSFVMNKRTISHILGNGHDVCLYHPRGMLQSTGYPTEAGLYNDIESVFDSLDYNPNEICIWASCGETFPAMHLFQKHHADGINMVLKTPPASLERAVLKIPRIAAWIFSCFKYCIQAPEQSKSFLTPQDNFNSIGKLQSLPYTSKPGYVVLVGQASKTIAPPADTQEIANILETKGYCVSVISR